MELPSILVPKAVPGKLMFLLMICCEYLKRLYAHGSFQPGSTDGVSELPERRPLKDQPPHPPDLQSPLVIPYFVAKGPIGEGERA